MARERLDKLLVDRGLAASRERARALIMSGAVQVSGQPETKPGTLLQPDVEITLREEDHPYVSRGALKLVKGLDTFAIDPAGMTCLDIGASTGGFTDVLLKRGAKRVYAIDVGYGQLAWSLRQDPRVVVHERTNARTMDPALVPEPCDLAVIDVSFISLTLVLPRVVELLRPLVVASRPTTTTDGARTAAGTSSTGSTAATAGISIIDVASPVAGSTGTSITDVASPAAGSAGKAIVALVKPQFEVGRDQVGKGGVVRDEAVRRSAVDKIRTWAAANGLDAGDDVESPITGPAGNVEYLLLLRTR